MNSQDYKTLHEANWLSTLIAGAGDASGSKFLKKVAVSIDEKIQNGGNTYSPTAIKGNIAKSAMGLTAVFPVVVTEATSVENATMISKAIEKKAVAMLQMLFAANQITSVKSAKEYLNTFHNNLSGSLDLSGMDIDDVIDSIQNFGEETNIPIVDMVEAIKEDCKYNIGHTLSTDINPTSLGDFRIRQVYGEATAYNPHRINQGTETTTERRVDPTTGETTVTTTTRDVSGSSYTDSDPTDSIKKSYETINKQVLDGDIKKANEAMPSLMIINFTSELEAGHVTATTCVIGVKAMLHYVSSQDLVNRVILKNTDNKGLFNFIRATTREISFFKDFLFAVDRAKVDAVAKSGKGSSNKIWKLLELRANRLKAAHASNHPEVGCAAITTLIISQPEVELIKKAHRIDLSKPGTLLAIMRGYNLMGACIVDEVSEKVNFLFDDGTKNFETLSFMSLEREESGAMYKKVINLVSKGR